MCNTKNFWSVFAMMNKRMNSIRLSCPYLNTYVYYNTYLVWEKTLLQHVNMDAPETTAFSQLNTVISSFRITHTDTTRENSSCQRQQTPKASSQKKYGRSERLWGGLSAMSMQKKWAFLEFLQQCKKILHAIKMLVKLAKWLSEKCI